MTQRTRIVLCGTAVLAASVLVDTSPAHAGFCGSWGCSGNSATVGDGIVFDELNVNGSARKPDGVRIVSAMQGPVPVKLNVNGHVLTATAGGRTLHGEELLGIVITLGKPDGRQYQARIEKVCTVKEQLRYKQMVEKQLAAKEAAPAKGLAGKPEPCKEEVKACAPLTFWVKPEDVIPYFELKVRKTQTRTPAAATLANLIATRNRKPENYDDRGVEHEFKEQICKGEGLQKDVLWKDVRNSAIFYEGDFLDPDVKRVAETVQTDGWFNLACAGAVPAKMHLLRHTRAGSDSAHVTTTDQRTAMLKMLTADYCGDGRARTADNTELRYKDARGWYSYENWDPEHPGDKRIEAVWGPEGALCLNQPRRDPKTPPASPCGAPAVQRPEVAEDSACKARRYPSGPPWGSGTSTLVRPIPRCDRKWASEWHNAMSHANTVYVISAVPPPPKGDYCDSTD